MDAPLVAVEIPVVGDPRRKHWAKVVSAVDQAKASGWAFVGDFVADGGIQDIPAGSVVLCYGERGSRANPQIEARVFLVNPDSTLSEAASTTGRAWARTLRDTVDGLLDQARPTQLDWMPAIELFNSQALADELGRRGWEVHPPTGDTTSPQTPAKG